MMDDILAVIAIVFGIILGVSMFVALFWEYIKDNEEEN